MAENQRFHGIWVPEFPSVDGVDELHRGAFHFVLRLLEPVEEGFFGYCPPRALLLAHVDGGQEMVCGTRHLAVGQEAGFVQRTEVEDASQVKLVAQTPDVLVAGIMQVGGAQQHAATHFATASGG